MISADFRGYMTQCYHHQCDNLTYVTDTKIGFIAKTARTLISVVDSMAPAVEAVRAVEGMGPSGTHVKESFGFSLSKYEIIFMTGLLKRLLTLLVSGGFGGGE